MTKLDLQFFGEETETPENTVVSTEESAETVDTGGEQSEKVASVTMTQDELDALIGKTKAQATRKAKREAQTGQSKKVEVPAEADTGENIRKETEERLALANKRLIKGTVLSMGDETLTVNGKKALLEFGNFDDCFDEVGELNEDDIKDKMKEFAETYPEFSKKEENPNKVVLPPAGQAKSDPTAWNPKAAEVAPGRQLNAKFKQFN